MIVREGLITRWVDQSDDVTRRRSARDGSEHQWNKAVLLVVDKQSALLTEVEAPARRS